MVSMDLGVKGIIALYESDVIDSDEFNLALDSFDKKQLIEYIESVISKDVDDEDLD